MGDQGGAEDRWGAHLGELIDAEPLAPTIEEAVRPMEGLEWPASVDTPAGAIRMSVVRRVLATKRNAMRAVLQRLGCPEFGEDNALAIHLYTKELDFRLYAVLTGQLHHPDRGAGPGGMSDGLRRCLPYTKFLSNALETAPEQFIWDGVCHRGIKFAYSSVGTAATVDDHDPAAYFPVGRVFQWFEFKSA